MRTVASLLSAAVLLGAALGGCASAGDPAPERKAEPPLQFTRSGRSTDLLPSLASRLEGSPPPRSARLGRLGPGCGTPRDPRAARCKIVEIGGDRRRALILDTPMLLELDLRAEAGERLRFSAALLPERPREQRELRVVLGDGPEAPSWSRLLRRSEGWVAGEIAVERSGPQTLRIEVLATAEGALGSDPTAVALAAPRLVSSTASRADGSPTNVIFYLIDTLRADRTTVGGYERDTTPQLAALARSGVAFERAYSAAAHTRPSTATMMTSLYPSQHRAWRGRGLSHAVDTLAERFRDAGWSTWAFVANGHVFGGALNFDQGFDRFQAIPGVRRDNHARTEEVNALLLPQLEAFADEPFFLYVHVVDPHSPYDPPPSVRGTFTDPAYDGPIRSDETRRQLLQGETLDDADLAQVRGLYDEDILYQDASLRVLVERLRALDLLDRTLIVVVSDHGDEFLEHGGWEHGKRLYEEQIHVPFVLSSAAAAMPKGRRVASPVSLVDLMPTLLSLWSIPLPARIEGRDLRAEIQGAESAPQPVYAEEWVDLFGPRLRSYRDGRWKVIERVRSGENRRGRKTVLYDLEAGEQEDVGARHPEKLADLSRRLEERKERLAERPRLPRGPRERLDARTRAQLEALGYVLPGKDAE